jgi:hypothetical protein
MKKLFICMALAAPLLSLAQDIVKIGRSQLNLPDFKQWTVEPAELPGLTYSGDASGIIPIESKRMTLRNNDGLIKAVATASMTKSAVSAQMSFSNHCTTIKPNDNVFVLDKGSHVRVDCLIVVKTPNTAAFSKRVDESKIIFNGLQPHTASAYYVQFDLGLNSGAKTASYALLAEGFQGIAGDSISNNSRIPDGVIRWALSFAKANAAALTSFSGDWTFPALIFN